VAAVSQHLWAAAILLGGGGIGIAATIAKNIAYAMRSEVDSLRDVAPRVTFRKRFTRLWYRTTVAYLPFIQPLARVRGRIRGVLSPPEVALPEAERQRSRGPRPSLGESWRALRGLAGAVSECCVWSDSWASS